MNRIRIGDINVNVTRGNECPSRAIEQVRFRFVIEVPSSTRIATEGAPAEWKAIQNTPKWTLSGTLDYDTPLAGGRLNLNTTVSYRSASQQFELAIPGLDQGGFALWDANLLWRSSGNRFELGLHGKNLANKKYLVSGYNFLRQDPYTGAFILGTGAPGISSTLGATGVLTGFYGNPRQVWLSAAVNF